MGDPVTNAADFDQETIQLCLAEMGEHVDAMEKELLGMESAGAASDPDRIHRIFRAAHTLKGTAGFMGMARIRRLSHALENLLGRIRDGNLDAERRVCDPLLRGTETLRALLDPEAAVDDSDMEGLMRILSGLSAAPDPEGGTPSPESAPAGSRDSWTPAPT
jgi:two-component system chemotaxis sensor kinase CheA